MTHLKSLISKPLWGGGVSPEPEPEPEPEPDTHEYVDLGLPSGTLWGADLIEEDDGEGNKVYYARCIKDDEGNELYFAWGETQGYTRKQIYDKVRKFDFANYKFHGKSKYNESDGKTILDPEDDAATVNLGSGWKMPTSADFRELLEETEYHNYGTEPTFTKNGKSLVLPMYGYASDYNVFHYDDVGSSIWASDLDTDDDMLLSANRLKSITEYETVIEGILREFGSIVVPVKKNN